MTKTISTAQRASFATQPADAELCLHMFSEHVLVKDVAKHASVMRHCWMQGIGSAESPARYYYRFLFRSSQKALAALDEWNLSGVSLIVVTRALPAPARFVLRSIGWLFHYLPYRPRHQAIPASYFSGTGNPTRVQYESLVRLSHQQSGPVWMINFNLLRDTAQYNDGTSRGCTGKDAYGLYAKRVLKFIYGQGGSIDWLGNYAFTALGNDGDPAPDKWHEIAVVHYPSLTSFHRMINSEGYLSVVEHRKAALKAASLIVSGNQPASLNEMSL
jgi:uncharacterized protein (DUF1330 family)